MWTILNLGKKQIFKYSMTINCEKFEVQLKFLLLLFFMLLLLLCFLLNFIIIYIPLAAFCCGYYTCWILTCHFWRLPFSLFGAVPKVTFMSKLSWDRDNCYYRFFSEHFWFALLISLENVPILCIFLSLKNFQLHSCVEHSDKFVSRSSYRPLLQQKGCREHILYPCKQWGYQHRQYLWLQI